MCLFKMWQWPFLWVSDWLTDGVWMYSMADRRKCLSGPIFRRHDRSERAIYCAHAYAEPQIFHVFQRMRKPYAKSRFFSNFVVVFRCFLENTGQIRKFSFFFNAHTALIKKKPDPNLSRGSNSFFRSYR